MNFHEYQAKQLFADYGIAVPKGIVARTPDDAVAAAKQIPGDLWVIKAQIHAGGRGKAGGVKVAKSPAEAKELSEKIFGLNIKDHIVKRVMVAQGASIAKEFYFSVLLDRSNRTFLSLCSVEGGMEIEQLAEERPEALAKVPVSATKGIDLAEALSIAKQGGFDDETAAKVAPVFVKLYEVFVKEDATLVEVNPLVLTNDGEIIALDGKVSLDDNAEFRHEREAMERDQLDPLEAKAKEMDLNSHRAKTMIIEEASTEIDDIKITGDTALSIVTMTAKGKLMGTPLEGKFRYFRVWQRFDDQLKVIGASFMQLP